VQQVLLDRQVYIADGHHRYETGVNYRNFRMAENPDHTGSEPYNFILTYLANIYDEGLIIFPLHRMVRNLMHFDAEELLSKLEEDFSVQPLDDRAGLKRYLDAVESSHAFGFVSQKGVYGIRLKGSPEDILGDAVPRSLCRLGVEVLHEIILWRLLGISQEAMQSQTNLVYTEDDREVFDAVAKGDIQAGFIVKSTTVSQVQDVSGQGDVMPQKSTYFYPKIMTGLVMHRL